MSAVTRESLLVYSTIGIILLVYGVTSYLKSPQTFLLTASLLQFPLILILVYFLTGIVVSYTSVYQEKELLNEHYRELEVLNRVALSIGEHGDLSRFLLRLSKLLSETFELERCTAILMDSKESNCYMVSSDDFPEKESKVINLEDFPILKESLQAQEICEQRDSPLPMQTTCKCILKKVPLSFKGKRLGTLYLRANTLKDSLTRREDYFLEILGRITTLAISNAKRSIEKSMVLENMIDL
jgi:transcriptional regulator with GAF, ATPase, and Fis domain